MTKGKAQVLDSIRRKRGPKGVKRYDNEFHWKTKRKKKGHDQEFQSKILSSRKVNLTLKKRQPGSLQGKVTHTHIYVCKYAMMYSYMCVYHDPENHNDVITHLEPDILECEVKWALESITTNKLVEVMEFQLSCFKS